MTTCRHRLLAALLMLAAGTLGAQSHPKELTWTVAELAGEGDWPARLALLLVREWLPLSEHRLTPAETGVLKTRYLDASRSAAEQQISSLRLAYAQKELAGTLAAGDPAAQEKLLQAQNQKVAEAREGRTSGAEPPQTLTLKAVWPSGKETRPWPAATGAETASGTQTVYAVTGAVRSVGPALAVSLELYSAWEQKTLVRWEGVFAPEEAAGRMAEAADAFRGTLAGRPWSRVAVSGGEGVRIQLSGVWHPLPWTSGLLDPGPARVVIARPGMPEEERTLVLEEGKTLGVTLEPLSAAGESLVIETTPSGALLYLDSRYLGPSPQTILRPRVVSRVRAEVPGQGSQSWEIGPDTPTPALKVLDLSQEKEDVGTAKDRFYWSLAAFSASLTTAAFAAAWSNEQVTLANYYAAAGTQSGYDAAVRTYWAATGAYVGSVVLTSGLFVWMMFELGDYLAAAQASLP